MDREYEFIINGKIQVFFTQESRIEFYGIETDEMIFDIDPTDLSVVLNVYDHVMGLFTKYDLEDEKFFKEMGL